MNHQSLSSFIWSVADLLRGDYKQSDYGKVILPFTVLSILPPQYLSVGANLVVLHTLQKNSVFSHRQRTP